MHAVVLAAVMNFCPLLHGDIAALQAYHTDNFDFVGALKYHLKVINPSPFDFYFSEIELVLRDPNSDSFRGVHVKVPRTRVPARALDGTAVDVTFEKEDLDFRLLVGELIICDGIR